jgi:hypothetical protein
MSNISTGSPIKHEETFAQAKKKGAKFSNIDQINEQVSLE